MPKTTGVPSLISKLARRRVRIFVFALLGCSFLFGGFAYAQLEQAQQQTQLTTEAAGIEAGGGDLVTIIGRIINVFLSLLGVIFLVLLLYAGYLWMTAAGDPEKVKKAQNTIKNALIGLVIIASAWAITSFILGFFVNQEGGIGGITIKGAAIPKGLPRSAGSLGGGIIEYHLPDVNATDIPRNTPIIITFKQPISPESMIQPGTGQTSSTQGIYTENVQIYKTSGGPDSALTPDKVRVSYTSDKKTFVFKPLEYLGSAVKNEGYTVVLKGGANGINFADGTDAFIGTFSSGYSWSFEVSTKIDLTPPYVVAAIPEEGGSYKKNVVIQINFNEAVDPTATTGKTSDGFSNIEVRAGAPADPDPQPVSGEFRISNKYRTVEFIPDESCGINTCGREIFCLPGQFTITVNAKAADIDSAAPPQAIFYDAGYNGVVDVVGNSLDANHDGTAGDSKVWSFQTEAGLDLTPPQIETILPSSGTEGSSNVPLDEPITVQFDSLLQSSTLNTDTSVIKAHGRDEKDPDTFWWNVGMKLLTAGGAELDPNAVPPDLAQKAGVVINHRVFQPSGDGIENLNFYDPYLLSGIQDGYQNCFNPAAQCGATGQKGNPHCCNTKSQGGSGCKEYLLQ